MLNYKKPQFWIIISAIIACVVATVCFQKSLINPRIDDANTKIDDALAVFLDNTIVSQNSGDKTGDNFKSVDYKTLETKESGTETTVYLWVLYEEYTYDGELKLETGSHIPTVITANKKGNTDGDSYELIEYWMPRDGSYYVADIKDKFPKTLWNKALNSQWCAEEQQANCLKSAQEHYGISTSTASSVDGPSDAVTHPTSTLMQVFLEPKSELLMVEQ